MSRQCVVLKFFLALKTTTKQYMHTNMHGHSNTHLLSALFSYMNLVAVLFMCSHLSKSSEIIKLSMYDLIR